MNKKYAGILMGMVIALASAPTYAQLGGLANSLLGEKGSSKSVTAESIVQKYVDGSKDVMTADVHLLHALGLKEQAAKEELAVKNLTEGATVSGLEDAAAIQTESSKMLAEKMNEKKVVIRGSIVFARFVFFAEFCGLRRRTDKERVRTFRKGNAYDSERCEKRRRGKLVRGGEQREHVRREQTCGDECGKPYFPEPR